MTAATLAWVVMATGDARAAPAAQGAHPDPPSAIEPDADPDVDRAFRYAPPREGARPVGPTMLRAVVEEAGVLGLGYLQYVTDKSNSRDWELTFGWDAMRGKLLLESVGFDNNRFATNWAGHAGAGLAYYTAARSNRIGPMPALAMSALTSTLWEFVGEWREQVSLNDLISTPVSGFVVGEAGIQLGSLMQRARPTVASRVFAWFFAPLKSLHDVMDGAEPARGTRFDRNGFPADEYHRLRVGTSVGLTHQEGGGAQADARASFESRVVTLAGYGGAGKTSGYWQRSEASDLAVRLGASADRVVDFRVAASVLPAGYRAQDVRVDRDGALRGTSTLTGLLVDFEYHTHDYDRDGRRGPDRIGLVGTGARVEELVHMGGPLLRLRLDLAFNFAGVDAYALPAYRRAAGDARLTSVLRNQRYYHAYGSTVHPSFEIESGILDAGGAFRLDMFATITGLDVTPPEGVLPESPAHDRRMQSRAWIGVTARDGIRFSITGEHRHRSGTMPGVSASRYELGAHFGIDAVF